MKKPTKKDYCSEFSLDSEFITYDSKSHARDLEDYTQYLEKEIKRLQEQASLMEV